VVYRAVVLNVLGNQTGATLGNSAEFDYTGSDGAVTEAAADITVVEPTLTIAKTVSDALGGTYGALLDGQQAGDTVYFKLDIAASDVTAHDLFLRDVFNGTYFEALTIESVSTSGGGNTFVDGVVTALDTTHFAVDGTTLGVASGIRVGLEPDVALELIVSAQLTTAVKPNQELPNVATIRWSSLDESLQDRSIHNAASDARTGGVLIPDAGVNLAQTDQTILDNYAATSGSVTAQIETMSAGKTLFATSEPSTDPDVTIGEIVTYALKVTLPEGTTPSLVVVDQVPAGMAYVSATVVTTTAASGGLLAANFNGTLPSPGITGGAGDGDDVTLTFGSITVEDDDDPDTTSFLVLVELRVLDVVGNVGLPSSQTVLSNTATFTVPDQPLVEAGPVDVTVVEPRMTIDKSMTPADVDAGGTVTVTLTVGNTGTSTAFDVVIEDELDGTAFDVASVDLGASGTAYPAGFTAERDGDTVRYSGGSIGAASTAVFTFTVDLLATVDPGEVIDNTATVTQATTLPGEDDDERDVAPVSDSDAITVPSHGLSGFVYHDANNDGVKDPGESGIAGVTITLTGTDHLGNPVEESTTTDEDGFYEFQGLRPGIYTLTETQPTGYLDGKETSGTPWPGTVDNTQVSQTISDIEIPVGIPSTTGEDYNFGEVLSWAIGDRVWLDENGDGIQDAGEDGIANVVVELVDGDGVVVATTVTDTEGNYLFTGGIPGTYTVRIDTTSMPAGLAANPTYDEDGVGTPHASVVTIAQGDTHLTADFGYNWSSVDDVLNPGPGALGAIGDRVWIDANGDGVQDPGEPGLAGVWLALYHDHNSNGVYSELYTVDGYNPYIMTDANGNYIFDNLPPGAYQVHVLIPPFGYTQTGDPDYFGQLLPHAERDNRTTMPIILAPGDVFVNADFGYQPAASSRIGDRIWLDWDADGVQDGGEPGIPGVTVALLNNNGKVMATTTTDADGNYLFSGLPAGTYTVWVNDTANLLGGLTQTGDPDLTLDGRHTLTVDGTNDYLDNDFGYTPNGHVIGAGLIGDRIWLDTDGDGVQDADESGLQGVTVELYDETGTILLASTVTDANGNYWFGGLADATYIVKVDTTTLPSGGTGLTNTGDPDGTFDSESEVTITGGSIDLGQDFGYQAATPNTIGGTIWEDRNADGTLDGGETKRFEGVTVVLRDDGGHIVGTTATDGNGDYSFTGLPDGIYSVEVTDDANLLNGHWHTSGTAGDGTATGTTAGQSQSDPYTVSVSSDDGRNATVDFGYYVEGAAIGNRVWHDVNADGFQNQYENSSGVLVDEPGIAGVLVRLEIIYPNGVTDVVTTMSGTGGFYSFGNLLLDENQDGTNTATPTFVLTVVNPNDTRYPNHTVFSKAGDPHVANNSVDPNGAVAFTVQGRTDVSLNTDEPYDPALESEQAWYDFGFTAKPTLAVISAVRARVEDGVAVISWDVELEIDTVGYHLERWADEAWVRINPSLIGADPFAPPPLTYEQADPEAPLGTTQRYRIVELDGRGRLLHYGPYDLKLDGGEISYATWAAGIDWGGADASPDADPDGDGLTNWQEYLAGTDPLNANSVLRVTQIRPVADGIEITWSSVQGRVYAVEMALAPNGPFTAIATGISAEEDESATRYVVPVHPAAVKAAFFRVVVE